MSATLWEVTLPPKSTGIVKGYPEAKFATVKAQRCDESNGSLIFSVDGIPVLIFAPGYLEMRMSTYYFLFCNECNEMTDAASRTAGGFCHLGDSEETLIPFIIAHSGHTVDILSEDYANDIEALRWTKDNVSEMVGRAEQSGNWLNRDPSRARGID